MLSRKEFYEKKKYIIERLKGQNSELEEEKLKTTLLSLMAIETENDDLKNVRLYNFINALSKGRVSLKREQKMNSYYPKLSDTFQSPITDEYLSFLIQLAKNVSEMQVVYDEDSTELIPFQMDDEKKVELSKVFYSQLGNSDINEKAQRVLSDSSHFGFSDTVSKGNELLYGITVYDTIFNKPYITTQRLGNIMGCQAFNHEIMHGVDFYFHPNVVNSQRYYGFHETPTYTIDYLFHDFMDSMGFDKQQVDALRRKKQQYTQALAKYDIIGKIQHRLNRTIGMRNTPNATIQDIMRVVDTDILKSMLELQSCVMAHGLYQQILTNKETGLANLSEFMSTTFPPDKIPDFSFVGLDNQTLLQISRDMGKIGDNVIQAEQVHSLHQTEISAGRSR